METIGLNLGVVVAMGRCQIERVSAANKGGQYPGTAIASTSWSRTLGELLSWLRTFVVP